MKTSAAWVLALGMAMGVSGAASAQNSVTPKVLTLSGTGLTTVRITNQYGDYPSVGFYMSGTSTRGTLETKSTFATTNTVKTGTALVLQIRLSATGADNATIVSQLHACTILAKQRGATSVYISFRVPYAMVSLSTVESNGTNVTAALDSSAIGNLHCD